MVARLNHIRNWIFDLDNTLYPARASLFVQIEARMTDYVANHLGLDRVEARRVQKQYFHAHGTTLAGMMVAHGVDPHEFLEFVHDVDLSVIGHNAALAEAIGRLPGRRLVFTNGDAPYAAKVLARLGLADVFDGIYDVHAMDYLPKPHPSAYAGLVAAFGVDPGKSLFADDMTRNLKPAKDLGMMTVWVDNGSEQGPAGEDLGTAHHDFVDVSTADITHWLNEILE